MTKAERRVIEAAMRWRTHTLEFRTNLNDCKAREVECKFFESFKKACAALANERKK